MSNFNQKVIVDTPSYSVFPLTYESIGTLRMGLAYPISHKEVLPGDSIKMKHVNSLVRMTTSIHPTMDRAYLDVYFFFVVFEMLFIPFFNLSHLVASLCLIVTYFI